MIWVVERLRARRISAAAVSAACLALATSITIAGAAQVDEARAAAFGMALAGVAALVSGLGVVAICWRRFRHGAIGESPRLLLGVGVMVWGAGQLLVGLQVTSDGRRSPGIGDLVSALCLPLLVLALISMPRQSRVSWPTLRLVLDSTTVAVAITLGLWWHLLQPALPDPAHPGGAAVFATLMTSFDVVMAAMTALIWARDRRQGAAAVAVGLALQAVADILSLPAVAGDRPLPWLSGAIWCVAIALLAVGIVGYSTASVSNRAETLIEDLGESRATIISTVVALVVLLVAMGVPVPHRWTAIGVVLSVVVTLLLLTREVLDTLVRNRMVRWLNAEALRDVLTGLPNRTALTARIRTLDLSRPWVLLNVDLDGFKEVNDLFGPESGDELIVLVGMALRRTAPARCLVARMGGDEFGVLAPGTIDEGMRLAERISAAVHRVADERGGAPVSVSIGVGRVTSTARDASASAGVQGGPATGAASRPATGAASRPATEATGWEVRATAGRAHAEAAGAHADSSSADGGVRTKSGRPDRLNALLESAAALRAAKAAGRSRIVQYPGEVERARQRRLRLEARLRTAIMAGALDMHAQPLVDLATGRITGFESLARWTDEELGTVSPGEFVPVAEESGLINPLGEYALRTTLLRARACGLAGRPVEVGVNVSPIQLRNRAFAPMVIDLIAESGMTPNQLVLEVTEAIMVDQGDVTSGCLAQLSSAGIRLAIDDFGTGYSALSYLRWLPVNVIKIDRSWVVASVTETRTRDIVGGVVSLAHTMGATVVMEGIEDEQTAALCRELGADIGQGWLFGRPSPWPMAAELVPTGVARAS